MFHRACQIWFRQIFFFLCFCFIYQFHSILVLFPWIWFLFFDRINEYRSLITSHWEDSWQTEYSYKKKKHVNKKYTINKNILFFLYKECLQIHLFLYWHFGIFCTKRSIMVSPKPITIPIYLGISEKKTSLWLSLDWMISLNGLREMKWGSLHNVLFSANLDKIEPETPFT